MENLSKIDFLQFLHVPCAVFSAATARCTCPATVPATALKLRPAALAPKPQKVNTGATSTNSVDSRKSNWTDVNQFFQNVFLTLIRSVPWKSSISWGKTNFQNWFCTLYDKSWTHKLLALFALMPPFMTVDNWSFGLSWFPIRLWTLNQFGHLYANLELSYEKWPLQFDWKSDS